MHIQRNYAHEKYAYKDTSLNSLHVTALHILYVRKNTLLVRIDQVYSLFVSRANAK